MSICIIDETTGGSLMKIGKVSDLTNVSMRSLRYYEEKGLIHPERLENGYRNYDEAMLEQVKTIKLYFELGLTIEEISSILNCDTPVCRDVIAVYENKIEEIRNQVKNLNQVESQLQKRLEWIYKLKEKEK